MKKLKDYFDLLNITEYHKAGYKGKGIKIMTMEKSGNFHKKQVQGIIREISPEAEIYNKYWRGSKFVNGKKVYDFDKAIDWAIDNKIDIIEISQHGDNFEIYKKGFKRAIDNGIIIVCASGNQGKDLDDVSVFASTGLTIDVGSTTDDFKFEPHTNHGKQLELVSFDTFELESGIQVLKGTSFAAPIVAAQIGLILSVKKGLNQHGILEIIKNNVKDLGIKGKDDRFGYGLFILPKINELKGEVSGVDKIYLIPFKSSKNLNITSVFGMRLHPVEKIKKMHNGIDLTAKNWDITSSSDGKVIFADYAGKAGKMIVIENNERLKFYYMHLSEFKVKKGDTVVAGQEIGIMGSTGSVTGAHLHFGIKNRQDEWLNPAPMLGIQNKEGVVKMSEKKTNKNEPSDWAKEEWQLGIDLGITDGTMPKENATREQNVAFIIRVCKKAGLIILKGGTYVWKV